MLKVVETQETVLPIWTSGPDCLGEGNDPERWMLFLSIKDMIRKLERGECKDSKQANKGGKAKVTIKHIIEQVFEQLREGKKR